MSGKRRIGKDGSGSNANSGKIGRRFRGASGRFEVGKMMGLNRHPCIVAWRNRNN